MQAGRCPIMHCVFSLLQRDAALGASKHGLCIDDWSPNQIRGTRGGRRQRRSALNLSASPSLSSPSAPGDVQQREAFYCNEEKCINLASACAQMECRPGEGAPSGSFFLIKDAIAEDSGGEANSVCKVSTPPPPCSPPGPGEPLAAFCFTSSAGFTQGSGPPPPDAAFNAIPPAQRELVGTRRRQKTYMDPLTLLDELRNVTAFCVRYSKWTSMVGGVRGTAECYEFSSGSNEWPYWLRV